MSLGRLLMIHSWAEGKFWHRIQVDNLGIIQRYNKIWNANAGLLIKDGMSKFSGKLNNGKCPIERLSTCTARRELTQAVSAILAHCHCYHVRCYEFLFSSFHSRLNSNWQAFLFIYYSYYIFWTGFELCKSTWDSIIIYWSIESVKVRSEGIYEKGAKVV